MSYDPPTGKELKVAQLILREYEKWVRKLDDEISDTGPRLHNWNPDFLVEGVRVNGHQRLSCTVLDCQRELHGYIPRLRKHITFLTRSLTRFERLQVKIAKAMKGLAVCPSCRGASGKEKFNERSIIVWTDCSRCDGTGLIAMDDEK